MEDLDERMKSEKTFQNVGIKLTFDPLRHPKIQVCRRRNQLHHGFRHQDLFGTKHSLPFPAVDSRR